MGRNKENKSKLAGDRLYIARLIYGKESRSKLLDWERWTGLVEIYDESTIKRWENNGVPASRLSHIAECFNIPSFLFTNVDITNETFRKMVELRKENQQADIGIHSEATTREPIRWLEIPDRQWKGSPSALLRADLAIVPFHGREQEMFDLKEWVLKDQNSFVRLLTGSGGMGKTRLAREVCLQLRSEGVQCGFLDFTEIEECLDCLKRGPQQRMFVVVDYAETAEENLSKIIRIIAKEKLSSLRFLLLSRGAGQWWNQLKRSGDGVDDCLNPMPEKLRPLSLNTEGRRQSYRLACLAFSQKLGKPNSTLEPSNFDEAYYERTLMLHMSALLAIEGDQPEGMNPILKALLEREIAYWIKRLRQRHLPHILDAGFDRVMGIISAYGGVQNKTEAVKLISKIKFFRDQQQAVIEAIADILHECFPGSAWIEPIQPDLLMEYLVARANKENSDDFDDIILHLMSNADG